MTALLRLAALAFIGGCVLASCGRPIPVEPCRILRADTTFAPDGRWVGIVIQHAGDCR